MNAKMENNIITINEEEKIEGRVELRISEKESIRKGEFIRTIDKHTYHDENGVGYYVVVVEAIDGEIIVENSEGEFMKPYQLEEGFVTVWKPLTNKEVELLEMGEIVANMILVAESNSVKVHAHFVELLIKEGNHKKALKEFYNLCRRERKEALAKK